MNYNTKEWNDYKWSCFTSQWVSIGAVYAGLSRPLPFWAPWVKTYSITKGKQ